MAQSHVFVRGVRGHAPPRKFLKWCNLVRFRKYFVKIFSKINLKIVIFYIKITDNVLLRTIFRGIGAYSPDFLSLVRFGVFWSTVSVNFLLRKYYNYLNNTDMVLLRTSYMYGGFPEYYFNYNLVRFGVCMIKLRHERMLILRCILPQKN